MPVPRYSITDAAQAAACIRQLRLEAGDPDLDASFPATVLDDLDVDAVVEYTEAHRRVGPSVRAAELEHRAVLVEYQRQRETARYERRLFSVLQTGYQLGVHPVTYGAPMGLRSRQAVYDRRTRLTRKRAAAGERSLGDEGRAREWLDAHSAQLRALADTLVDCREELLELVDDGPAHDELVRNIDAAGTLLNSRRPTQDLCTAVALAVHLLRPAVARPASNPVVREQLAQGLRLLW
ncbi:hypothetical protein EDD30_7692 [Couchioplanes caeruleus]|uniref:Uncharacterized protein n=2 Tax=Couchioplanes caeruleus TaxID=56438 RepID=A0A1K0GBC7_9ACTN|nr:hypothetical protein BG844_09450 [Couchioplanes caeruleus subsp. caeruleus]ROP21294.1 hypothetical protein EDD30_7692 [Couchioplanes caeruleus]